MNYGKKVCASLRQLRKQIAEANDISYEVTECKHQGDCLGTCPKCEAELRYMETFQFDGNPPAPVGRLAGEMIPLSSELDEPAEYPGGEEALREFIKQNLRYPDSCIEVQVQGRVILMLIIEKDGKISSVQMKRSVCDDMTNEAIRIVKKMPKWKPAKMNGEKVRCREYLPITFRLE